MLQAATESPRVLRSPKPNVWLSEFGESRVEHEILVWISDPESGVGGIKSDVLNRLWNLFKEHGVKIPFPRVDVHIEDPSASLLNNGAEETKRSPQGTSRSEEHTSELQSLMRISYAVFCLKKKNKKRKPHRDTIPPDTKITT